MTDLELQSETLDGLATIINREHQFTRQAAETTLQHAIRCGEALREAKSRIPFGKWKEWAQAHIDIRDFSTIAAYIRLATYREELEAKGTATIQDSLMYLRELDAPRLHPHPNAHVIPVKEALALREEGMSLEAIAAHFGVSRSCLRRQIDPAYAKWLNENKRARRRRAAQAKRALERQQEREARDRLAKSNRGSTSKAYADVRRAAANIDRAMSEATEPPVKVALQEALTAIHRAEDYIVKAMRSERADDAAA